MMGEVGDGDYSELGDNSPLTDTKESNFKTLTSNLTHTRLECFSSGP